MDMINALSEWVSALNELVNHMIKQKNRRRMKIKRREERHQEKISQIDGLEKHYDSSDLNDLKCLTLT